jgi:myo-inositol catabolism protein IolC
LCERRTGAPDLPEAVVMNDLDIVCKGIVIIGLAASTALAVRS